MPTIFCYSDGTLLLGAEPFPSCPNGRFFLYHSQSRHEYGVPSFLAGSIQHYSSANSMFADSLLIKNHRPVFTNEAHFTTSVFNR